MILTLYEPFRHGSETGSVYILSDPHFGDSDCKLMDPVWIKPEEQVARINALVMKNDTFKAYAKHLQMCVTVVCERMRHDHLSDIRTILDFLLALLCF